MYSSGQKYLPLTLNSRRLSEPYPRGKTHEEEQREGDELAREKSDLAHEKEATGSQGGRREYDAECKR